MKDKKIFPDVSNCQKYIHGKAQAQKIKMHKRKEAVMFCTKLNKKKNFHSVSFLGLLIVDFYNDW